MPDCLTRRPAAQAGRAVDPPTVFCAALASLRLAASQVRGAAPFGILSEKENIIRNLLSSYMSCGLRGLTIITLRLADPALSGGGG